MNDFRLNKKGRRNYSEAQIGVSAADVEQRRNAVMARGRAQ